MNEEALIALFNRGGAQIPPGCLGAGDDASVMTFGEQSMVITTDLLTEGVHFLRESTSPEDLGHKALAVNLSDVAAMGATPLGFFLSIALPREIEMSWAEKFTQGMQSLARKFDCPLLGGDTTRAQKDITISITALGNVPTANIKLRSQAEAGDLLAVTGSLGNSVMGLMSLSEGWGSDLERFHLHPSPRVKEGEWLGQFSQVHAMMDISDGLSKDIPRMCKASELGAEIEVQQVPVDSRMRLTCNKYFLEAKSMAVSGGEDYELLIAVDPTFFRELAQKYQDQFGTELYIIGSISRDQKIRWFSGEDEWEKPPEGFEHF